MGYLVVDERNGRVLCEFDSLEDALNVLDDVSELTASAPPLSIVWADERPGALVSTRSTLRVRVGGI
jgi:hypothetical protein